MYELIEDEVVRNEYSTIPFLWIRSKQRNNSICIMLPGISYSTQQPLFHYATNLFAENGVDILHINYNFIKSKHFVKLNKTEQEHWMYEDVRTVVGEVLIDTIYEKCFLLSKSIGTIPMAMEWAEKKFINLPIGIWLTPLLKENLVFDTLLKTNIPSLCVIGDQDQHYLQARISILETNKLISTLVIPMPIIV
ncbi:hypothetical protein F4694_005552 [Bacillus niacini]|uniref:Alpha/beta hydrolase n=1 Tax=Neobacillus niacini TaxID=86668 RepID=A0A852TIS4_9BACI|nr:hypothetical protein [Neobacillus niacini]NYE08703.1 hypothetical protein [Neobacillus niacini]